MIYATWNYVSRQINSHNPIVFAPVLEINMCVCLIGESHDSSMHLHFIFLYFCILDCWLLLSEYASWILLTWQVQGSVHCLTGNEDDPDTFTTMKMMMPMMMMMIVMMLTMMMAHMAMKSMSAIMCRWSRFRSLVMRMMTSLHQWWTQCPKWWWCLMNLW